MRKFLEQYACHSTAFFSSGKYVTAIGIKLPLPLNPKPRISLFTNDSLLSAGCSN
jgi:hypothetical protein